MGAVQVADEMEQGGLQEAVLVAEMEGDEAGGDAGGLGDGDQRRGAVAALGDGGDGRLDQLTPAIDVATGKRGGQGRGLCARNGAARVG
jgi:hypothetical protein